jgi:hypothetical protein
MNIKEIQEKLAKKAVEFETGGFKPANTADESWIGRVYLYGQYEYIPLDKNKNMMLPLFQLSLKNLPFVPEILKDTKAITVFIAKNFPVDFKSNGDSWVLREYKITDELIVKDLKNSQSYIKPFPLKANFIEKDFPVWDGGGIPVELEGEILKLESSGEIESYYDIVENHYMHKLGGYPTFCQSGVDFGEDFEFVFQISSDEKARLNIIDRGTIFLAKNRKTGEWKYYSDFY